MPKRLAVLRGTPAACGVLPGVPSTVLNALAVPCRAMVPKPEGALEPLWGVIKARSLPPNTTTGASASAGLGGKLRVWRPGLDDICSEHSLLSQSVNSTF